MRGQATAVPPDPVLAASADRHTRWQEAVNDAKCPAPRLPPSRAVLAAMHGHLTLGTLSLRLEAGRSFRAGVLIAAG
jgi:hypothetical protein